MPRLIALLLLVLAGCAAAAMPWQTPTNTDASKGNRDGSL